jgi:hypothetical protein
MGRRIKREPKNAAKIYPDGGKSEVAATEKGRISYPVALKAAVQ